MAPNACAAAPRSPHVFQNGQDTCRMPPLLPYVRLHDRHSCKAPQHHTHGWPHALVACAATLRACVRHNWLVCMLHTAPTVDKNALPRNREELQFSLISKTWKSTGTRALPICTSKSLTIPPDFL
ncbi:hypothetical protein F2Q70_00038590 [Brassica cretica]|uniref:Uncharacterized protein n=1 Tax=Brassica cretica TaxID=69181 RepID=A0A8S9K4G3_BRACR|nr:hypothetical protein F2Q70_00038590 [Brassica cretica]